MVSIEHLFANNPYLLKIKELTNCGVRSRSAWHHFPHILRIENGKVEINTKAAFGKSDKSQVDPLTLVSNTGFVPTSKLKAESAGDWELIVGGLPCVTFATREDFDEAFCPAYSRVPGGNSPETEVYLKRLTPPSIESGIWSIRDVFKGIRVTLEIDMDHLTTAGSDGLKYKIQEKLDWYEFQQSAKIAQLEQLEKIFFYKAMTELFGNMDTAQKTDSAQVCGDAAAVLEYMVKDFKILSYDGNEVKASCQVKGYFLFFRYVTS